MNDGPLYLEARAAARDIRATGRPTRTYGVRDAIRDELREKPLSIAEVVGFLLGLAGVLLFLCLFLATGPQ